MPKTVLASGGTRNILTCRVAPTPISLDPPWAQKKQILKTYPARQEGRQGDNLQVMPSYLVLYRWTDIPPSRLRSRTTVVRNLTRSHTLLTSTDRSLTSPLCRGVSPPEENSGAARKHFILMTMQRLLGQNEEPSLRRCCSKKKKKKLPRENVQDGLKAGGSWLTFI